MSGELVPIGHDVEHEIRTIDLLAPPVLSDNAVEQLARAITAAVSASSDALGAVTRRESSVTIGEVLQPVARDEVYDFDATTMALSIEQGDVSVVVGLLVLDAEPAVGAADVFLGGPGHGVDRPTSPIERRAIAQTVGTVVGPLARAATFNPAGPVTLEPIDQDSIGIVPNQLVRLDMTWTIDGSSIPATLYVVDPDTRTGPATSTESQRASLERRVTTMPIELSIDLATVSMPAREIRGLATGDVVVFDAPIDAPAYANHGERTMLEGTIRTDGDRRSFEVTSTRV